MDQSITRTYKAINRSPSYKQIPHPNDSDIIALFRHQYNEPAEYMAVTENGRDLHLRPEENAMQGYAESIITRAEADADAECTECGSNRLAYGQENIGESTTMDVLECQECGHTQQ